LNGILGMADLLTATAIDDEQKSYVEAVRASGQSLGSLIEDLLDLSRIESGKLDVVSEPFAIASLVEGVVELLAPRAHAKGLEITSFIAPDVPAEMMGDAARLRQVLLNVAGNPVKFTGRGGVGLRVAREGRALAISVADTGPGVPFDRREAIFHDFEQGDDSIARQHGGSGLGLAISRRLIERMGGTLRPAQSGEAGSTLPFRCRLRVMRRARSRMRACPANPSSSSRRRVSRRLILASGLRLAAAMLLMPGVKGKRWRSSRARARRGKPCSSIARSARVRSYRSLKRRAPPASAACSSCSRRPSDGR